MDSFFQRDLDEHVVVHPAKDGSGGKSSSSMPALGLKNRANSCGDTGVGHFRHDCHHLSHDRLLGLDEQPHERLLQQQCGRWLVRQRTHACLLPESGKI